MARTLELIQRLVDHDVEFVLVGKMAAAVHGSSVVTDEVAVCLRFDLPTLTRVMQALQGSRPMWRSNPEPMPFLEEPATCVGWNHLLLVTDEGQLSLLTEVDGVGKMDDMLPGSQQVNLGGFCCRVIGIEDLIWATKVLGRTKDIRAALELDAIRRRGRPLRGLQSE